jgi:hypothetical protein
MNAWMFFAGVFALFAIIEFLTRNRPHLAVASSFLLLLFVFAGSIGNGADWIWYYDAYDEMRGAAGWGEALTRSPFEAGFSVLMYGLAASQLPAQSIAITCGTIYAIGWTWFIRTNTPYVSVTSASALLLLVEGWMLFNEQIRQGIAVIVVLAAYVVWLRQMRWTAFGLIVLASLFHRSALFGVILLWLSSRIQVTDSARVIVSYVGSLALALFSAFWLMVAMANLGFLQLLPAAIEERVLAYLSNDNYNQYVLTWGLLLHIVAVVLSVCALPTVRAVGNKAIFDAWLFSLCWGALGPVLRLNGAFVRFEHYFLIFVPVLCAFLLSQSRASTLDTRVPGVKLATIVGLLLCTLLFAKIMLNPIQQSWVSRYQNAFLFAVTGEAIEPADVRKWRICENLLDHGSDFCTQSAQWKSGKESE